METTQPTPEIPRSYSTSTLTFSVIGMGLAALIGTTFSHFHLVNIAMVGALLFGVVALILRRSPNIKDRRLGFGISLAVFALPVTVAVLYVGFIALFIGMLFLSPSPMF